MNTLATRLPGLSSRHFGIGIAIGIDSTLRSTTPLHLQAHLRRHAHTLPSSATRTMTSPLPPLPPITRLSPTLIRILAGNPSKFTLQGTNTYLLGSGPRRLLIDTGEGLPVWSERLRQVLDEEGASVEKVLVTHWHGDHVGGVKQVRELSSDATGGGLEVRKFVSPSGKDGVDGGFGAIEDGEEFAVEGVRVRAVHTPGHTDDHVAFLVAEDGSGEDVGALFAGDNVLGHGTAVFEDLGAYMKSLEVMEGVVGEGRRLFPAHGEWVADGRGKVREYIEHRRGREREALEVLGRLREDGKVGWESMEVVKVVYKDYPESLHVPAEGGLRLVLRKLEGEGRVREVGGRWVLGKGEEGKL